MRASFSPDGGDNHTLALYADIISRAAELPGPTAIRVGPQGILLPIQFATQSIDFLRPGGRGEYQLGEI